MTKKRATDGPLFRVAFEESIAAYEPAPVQLKINHKRAAPKRSMTFSEWTAESSYRPEIDPAEPFQFTVTSKSGKDREDYLKFSEAEALPDLVVRFYVEPSDKLTSLEGDNFNRVVQEEFLVTVKVKIKASSAPSFPEPRTVAGRFRVKVESRVKIHWKWEGHPLGAANTSGKDPDPVILHCDGLSWFELNVWTTECKTRDGKYVPSDPEAYEFSHWIAPEDPNINLEVFAPRPLPSDPKIKKERQAKNFWYSEADLPDLQRFPSLSYLPIETVIRVKAWPRHSIEDRYPYGVKASEIEVGEVEIPVRLVKPYVLAISVFMDGDDTPLKTYEERVNGERVKIFCINLPPDLDANIRWKVIGPMQYTLPPSSSIGFMPSYSPFFGLAGKRKFQTEDKETPLVPVVSPSGKLCLGTESEVEIVEDPSSEAKPPVYLDVEEPKLKVVLLNPKGAIKLDGKTAALKFGVTYSGWLGRPRPARNTRLFWRLITNPGKTQGRLKSTQGRTDVNGELTIEYDHDIRSIIESSESFIERRRDKEERLKEWEKGLEISKNNLGPLEEWRAILELDVPGTDAETIWRRRHPGVPTPSRIVPGAGGSFANELIPSDQLDPYGTYTRPQSPELGPQSAAGIKLRQTWKVEIDKSWTKEDIAKRWPETIDRTKREIDDLRRRIEETKLLAPKSEEIQFFRDQAFRKPINSVYLQLELQLRGRSEAQGQTGVVAPQPAQGGQPREEGVSGVPRDPSSPQSAPQSAPTRPPWRRPSE